MGNLCCPCHTIDQGHPKVMIYITFIELHSLMFDAKFQYHRPSGSGDEDFFMVFAIYSHGDHLGHVTLTIYINFHSLFLRMLHMKFGFDWPSGFKGELCILWQYAPGWEQTCPCGPHSFRIINLLSICPFPQRFSLQMTFFPFRCMGDLC